jgi:hypothetical protein
MTKALNHSRASHDDEFPFDWRPAIERLWEEARTARGHGTSDSLTEIEAECWIDLIDAEIAAHRRLDQSRSDVAFAVQQLQDWRLKLRQILDLLGASDHDPILESSPSAGGLRKPLDAGNSTYQIVLGRPPESGAGTSKG